MKNLVIFTISLFLSSTYLTFSQKLFLEFENSNRELFDNYKDLLYRIDDSIKVLKKNGIFFAGIDLVSGYLIGDINVTSPTGLPQFKKLTGVNLAKNYWDELEKLK